MQVTPEGITAAVGALAMAGGGIGFVWNKVEGRFTRIEGDLAKCHERDKASQERRTVYVSVIEILWQALERHEADNSKPLRRAKHLLDDLKRLTGG